MSAVPQGYGTSVIQPKYLIPVIALIIAVLAIVIPLLTPKTPPELQIEALDLDIDFDRTGPEKKCDWQAIAFYRVTNVGDRPAEEAIIVWRHGVNGDWLADVGGWADKKNMKTEREKWFDPRDTYEGVIMSHTAASPEEHILRGGNHLPFAILLRWKDPSKNKIHEEIVYYDIFPALWAQSASDKPVIRHRIIKEQLPEGFIRQPSFNPIPTAWISIEKGSQDAKKCPK